jgi:hypothetical protein
VRFWVYFLGVLGVVPKLGAYRGSSSAFAFVKTAADSQKALGEARASPPQNQKLLQTKIFR